MATLTGAQLVALGPRISGVMANDDALRDGIVDAAGRAGEAMWPMPLPDELRKGLDSAVADLANVAAERNGGMLVAGLFLQEFVPTGCAGRIWTSPGLPSMKASPMGISLRAGPAQPQYPGPDRAGRRGRAPVGGPGAGRAARRGKERSGGGERAGYDIVILGGGSGGYACALRAAELGKRVALIEKDKVGGTCLHRGCIPTKALLHAAEIADQARDEADFRRAGQLRRHRHGRASTPIRTRSLTGSGRACRHDRQPEGRRHLRRRPPGVADRRPGRRHALEGAHVVLATGSEARSLPGLAIDGHRVITSDHALELDHVPASAVILGGGVIGVEFASVWRSFGAEVTIVEMLPHLLPPEDESSSKLLERAFRSRGIGYQLGAKFEGVKEATPASPSPWRAATRSTPSSCSSPSAAARSRPASATRKPG